MKNLWKYVASIIGAMSTRVHAVGVKKIQEEVKEAEEQVDRMIEFSGAPAEYSELLYPEK